MPHKISDEVLAIIEDIAKLVGGGIWLSRERFSVLYRQAQHASDIFPVREFEAVATTSNDQEAFTRALRASGALGWLDLLLNLLTQEESVDVLYIMRAINKLAPFVLRKEADHSTHENGYAPTEAVAFADQNFEEPAVVARGVVNATRWTVRIQATGRDSNGDPIEKWGTGVLIGPNLVLTSWHILHFLFDWDATTGIYTPQPDTASNITVEFDGVLSLNGTGGRGVPVPLAEKWCVAFSPCTNEEIEDKLPTNFASLRGNWDYVILRLASAPGVERRWCAPDEHSILPQGNARLTLFQHPAKASLRTHFGSLTPGIPEEEAAVPCCRFLHQANSLGGSSGGPCFDKGFRLVGIHQGVWSRRFGVSGDSTKEKINRGIPLTAIIDHLKVQKDLDGKNLWPLPEPDPADFTPWHLGAAENYAPVIGCDDFLKRVWRIVAPRRQEATSATRKPILKIAGDHRSGKTFRATVLMTHLRWYPAEHLVIHLDGKTLTESGGRALAARIMELSAPLPAPASGDAAVSPSEIPRLPPPTATDSTGANWVKDVVLPAVMAWLAMNRAGRTVWLVLTDLNKARIPEGLSGEFATELLFRIYDQCAAKNTDWLRIVFDDLQTILTPIAEELAYQERAIPLTSADILTFYKRATAALYIASDPVLVEIIAENQAKKYNNLQTTPEIALTELAKDTAHDLDRLAIKQKTTLKKALAGGNV